jgi:hypothetical protein
VVECIWLIIGVGFVAEVIGTKGIKCKLYTASNEAVINAITPIVINIVKVDRFMDILLLLFLPSFSFLPLSFEGDEEDMSAFARKGILTNI